MQRHLHHRPRPARRMAWIAAVVGLALPAAVAAEGGGVADPPPGRWAETTLALLHYNRELCDGIAGKVLSHWRGLGSTPAAQLQAVRQFVVDRELSNLASGRAASDIVEGFLPRLRQEVGNQAGVALERLHRMEVELCDAVAYPSGGRQDFENGLRLLLDRIEREETELGRLLVIREEDVDGALDPYLGDIQLAGVEAEGEYRDYLDSLKPPPVQPTVQELMEDWHRRYAQAVRPTKQALGKYLDGRHKNDSQLLRTACREIAAAVIPLLRNKQVFKAPVPALEQPLSRAFSEIRQMAVQCSAGRSREMETHYREMQAQLASASSLLAEFSLKP